MTPSVFHPHERETIEAAMARIIPADHDPGAREAGAIDFLERYLSGVGHIYAKADGSGFVELDGRTARVWEERVGALRRQYAEGVAELDRRARRRFGGDFVDLAEEQQDAVLRELERGVPQDAAVPAQAAAASEAVETTMQQPMLEHGLDFFRLLILHTRQGFYADPIYGGNRGHAGWQTIGFAGPSSLADAHAGTWSTSPYFAQGGR